MFEIFKEAILPNILEIVVTIISLVVTYYVIPCIKNDLIPWLKEKRLLGIIKNFVQAAEKMAESGAIEKRDKKNLVIQLLENKGIVITETVEAFIESCVKELDMVGSVIIDGILEEDIEPESEELIEPSGSF